MIKTDFEALDALEEYIEALEKLDRREVAAEEARRTLKEFEERVHEAREASSHAMMAADHKMLPNRVYKVGDRFFVSRSKGVCEVGLIDRPTDLPTAVRPTGLIGAIEGLE